MKENVVLEILNVGNLKLRLEKVVSLFKCYQCDYTSTKRSNLNIHHNCNDCAAQFSSKVTWEDTENLFMVEINLSTTHVIPYLARKYIYPFFIFLELSWVLGCFLSIISKCPELSNELLNFSVGTIEPEILRCIVGRWFFEINVLVRLVTAILSERKSGKTLSFCMW